MAQNKYFVGVFLDRILIISINYFGGKNKELKQHLIYLINELTMNQ